jgi:hypothetical protein
MFDRSGHYPLVTFNADLTPCTRHALVGWNLIAVGWLDSSSPEFRGFPTGVVSPTLIEKLLKLAAVDQPNVFKGGGYHRCNLEECKALWPEIQGLRMGSTEIFVPTGKQGDLYCCPNLILHYIEAHAYFPPIEFQRAVEQAEPSSVPQLMDVALEKYLRSSRELVLDGSESIRRICDAVRRGEDVKCRCPVCGSELRISAFTEPGTNVRTPTGITCPTDRRHVSVHFEPSSGIQAFRRLFPGP